MEKVERLIDIDSINCTRGQKQQGRFTLISCLADIEFFRYNPSADSDKNLLEKEAPKKINNKKTHEKKKTNSKKK